MAPLFFRICLQGFFFWLAYDLSRFPVIPLFAQHLGLRPEAIGFAVAASTITGIFGKFLAGGLSDSLGRKILMAAACAVAVTAPLFYFLVDSAESLIVLRLFHGLGTAIMGPVGRAFVSDLVEKSRRGERLSTYTAATNLGTMAGRSLGGFLLFWGGFLFPFFASAVAGAVALAIAFRWPKDRRHPVEIVPIVKRMGEGFREVGSNRTVLITSVVEAIQFLATGAIDAFLPIYAKTVAGLTDWEVGSLYGVQVATTLVSKPFLGWLSDRVGRKPQILVGFLIGALVVWLLPWQKSFLVLSSLVVVYGLSVAITTSATTALVTDVCQQKHYGAAHGVFGTLFDAGHASGPITAGFLVAAAGYRWSFGFYSLLLFVASLLFGFLVREPKPAR
jgi:MFS family permease